MLAPQGMVKELRETEAVLSTGQVIPFGVCVWSTGVGPTPFIDSLKFAKTAKGRLAVDKHLRVLVDDSKGQKGEIERVSCEKSPSRLPVYGEQVFR